MNWLIYFYIIFYNICFLNNILVIGSGEPEMRSTGVRVVRKSYREVFDPLVQAILEGDNPKFIRVLKTGKYNLNQKLPFWRNLRHIAHEPKIDEILLRLGVAPRNEIDFFLISNEAWREYDDYVCDSGIVRYFNRKRGPRFLEKFAKYEREIDDTDVYGKFPEHYGYCKRKEFANQMMQDRYEYIEEVAK